MLELILSTLAEFSLFRQDLKHQRKISKLEKADGIKRPFQKYILQPSVKQFGVIFLITGISAFLFFSHQRISIYPEKTKTEISEIAERMDKWYDKFESYPKDLNELIGNSPLRQDWKTDAWNRPYQYAISGNGSGFSITSAGSDGEFETEDDIKTVKQPTYQNLNINVQANADSPAYTAEEIKFETVRSWNAYKKYAWGFDVLLSLSKSGLNWYDESLGICPFDAYSTLAVMDLQEEAKEIENYALSKNWDQDIYVQVFEVNIRILGGLLAIYDYSKNPEILDKAIDFGDRLLPAFNSPTGIPYQSFNLKTAETAGNLGEGSGAIVNTAQAATYLLEFGILSYYSQNPKYYQAAKKATLAVFERKSDIGLPGDFINVETGQWTNNWSYLQAGMDSYYEYLFKSNLLFPDPEIEEIWNFSLQKINEYYSDTYNGKQFYACVNMNTGEKVKRSMSLYDAFFPAVQALHGDIATAEKNMETWDWLWDKYGLLPTRYLYEADTIEYANSELNPEIIESAYYLHEITGKQKYLDMIYKYWSDIKSCCRNDVAFNSVEDVRTMEAKDYLATYFYAETLKYFYLAVVDKSVFDFDEYIFNTEAHPFQKSNFNQVKAKAYLGIN